MRAVSFVCAAVLVVGCTHSGGRGAGARADAESVNAEADLAAALGDRLAGSAQECVDRRDLGPNVSFGRGIILFGGRLDNVVYVNRPQSACAGLTAGGGLGVRTISTRLCSGDIVTVFDPLSGVEYGGCTLGAFTPYRRPDEP